MDEYDEMYGIEDDFEQQFADELEMMAEMDPEPPPHGKVSEFRNKKPISQTFDEAIASGDVVSSKTVKNQHPLSTTASISPSARVEEESLTPKPKKRRQDVVKKLQFGVDTGDDITPPSSPEVYDGTARDGAGPDRTSTTKITTDMLDMSGLTTLQDSPRRLTVAKRFAQKRPPAIGEYITVTDSTGNRVYLNKKEDENKAPDPRAFRNSQNGLGLLTVPIEVMKEQIAERRHRQVIEESQRLTELLNSGLNPELLAEGQTDSGVDGDSGEDRGSSSRLWVDQFSPRHYTELLSDDFTNRCLLKWLKLWDTVVFGRERKTRPTHTDVRSNFPNAQNQNQFQRFKTKSQITEEILEGELDQYKRPKFKVALLSGPPGLGKTTLAHIIAKHAGYNVVEINASDDRSAELFQKRIDTATQMKSVLGANEKPNCLIIDEIDGAPAAAINILLATINKKDSREGEETGVNALKKKKKKQSVLLRPIICICNDLYVPALRPLRQQAFLLTFPQTLPSRLTQRLAEITRCQGMKADTGTLMALCEKTDNDIRSCINTLQFLHGRGQKHLDQRSVSSMCVGLKDQNKGLFSVWQEIFQLPRVKRKRIGGDPFGGLDEAGPKDGGQRLQNILHLVSSNGEHEKLTQGLYDNFLSMKLKDPGMLGVCSGLDWLSFTDLLNECILHGQNYSLMRYLPFLPAAFHFLYAANSVPRINYPHSNYEALTKTQHTKNALLAMLNDIPPAVQSRICVSTLCLDIITLLMELISPKLRPVNPQLYSTREKQQLCDLIDTMINYNLTYRQDRTPEGQYTYVLEPNIEDVVRFPGLPPRRQLTYQVKQLIARETELEKMRRMERAQQKRNPQNTETVNKSQAQKKVEVKKHANHQQRLENIVKQTVVESRPELDFFGRALVPKEKPVVTTTGEDGKGGGAVQIGKAVGNSDVWFRFNEGVSNAVRRNVYIRELL
ncbi:chromosome transmission fidelity protein 18 homolog [Triplophysa dalaica]|uniref:chromosome transmission fidelity protein 18 homolog n=1 Tax=Triplophysa dalaica TaxID=1582913 RepID=UPI0024E026FC|nr:chromosome transmission fidelity protein 18 homolog [Triplophysa dalaica]XP_056618854.1 chromosome transmission fidelity protein 18 homolog [Triplophysa dalaica]